LAGFLAITFLALEDAGKYCCCGLNEDLPGPDISSQT